MSVRSSTVGEGHGGGLNLDVEFGRGAPPFSSSPPSIGAAADGIYPSSLADRLAAFRTWRSRGGTEFNRFRGAHTPAARGETLYHDPNVLQFGRWAQRVDSPHGNSALSSKLTFLYRLEVSATGQHLKWGITDDPFGRYPANFLRDKRMILENQGRRIEMLRIERRLIEISPGPLNREPWAGALLERFGR